MEINVNIIEEKLGEKAKALAKLKEQKELEIQEEQKE